MYLCALKEDRRNRRECFFGIDLEGLAEEDEENDAVSGCFVPLEVVLHKGQEEAETAIAGFASSELAAFTISIAIRN